MAAELVNAATNERLNEIDWMKNIEICELVTHDNRQAKDVIKYVKKRLKSKSPSIQLFAVMLLEMLMNNCGECIHRHVIDAGLLPILVKIVKKKNNYPVRERIFLLLDAMQTSLGGASGKFPQYYAAYYDLVAAQVEFPQQRRAPSLDNTEASNTVNNHIPPSKDSSKCSDMIKFPPVTETKVPDASVIGKASNVLEILREVLDAIDPVNPEGASDEFTLDLVEQCSFQKQRLMHLVMTCRDEKLVSQAIEVNEMLHGVLAKHDTLLSVKPTSTAFSINHIELEDEEEDADRLLNRLRKGKACAMDQSGMPHGSFRSRQDNTSRLPLAKPLCIEPDSNGTIGGYQKSPPFSQLHHGATKAQHAMAPSSVSLPPPPAKHLERERFFKEKKQVEGPCLSGHMRGLCFNSQDGSSPCGSSSDSNDRDPSHHDQH